MTDHPLDLLARAAYGAFAISSADRLGEMPPWDAIPPDAHADWRAVADAVQMMAALHLSSTALTVKTGVIHIEGTKLSEADVEELAGRWKAAWHKGEYKILPDDTEARIAEAVAAERERCAQLAEQVDAFYDAPCPDGVADCVHQDTPFADLLRQGGEGGGT